MTAIQHSPFPTPTKTSTALINSTPTTATALSFTDKLVITLTTSSGKLSHWVHVPLAPASGTLDPAFTSASSSESENALLPRTDLTATTVLGGTKREAEVWGQMLATTVASAVLVKRPGEERLLVLGVGVEGVGREGLEEVLGLILEVL